MANISYTGGGGGGGYNLATTNPTLAALPNLNPTNLPGRDQQLFDFFREMARRQQASQPPPMAMPMGVAAEPTLSVNRRRAMLAEPDRPERPGPRPTPYQNTWYEQQGAATRPVGLGPGMIPGMMADPRLLPPEMRPQAASASYSPGSSLRAQNEAGDDAAFQAGMARDRERYRPVQRPGDENYYGG